MHRQVKSAGPGVDTTPLELADDDATSSPYQSPSSASDVDASAGVTWHTPGGSPFTHDESTDPGDALDRTRGGAARPGVADMPSGPLLVTPEVTSRDVTAAAADPSSRSDVELLGE